MEHSHQEAEEEKEEDATVVLDSLLDLVNRQNPETKDLERGLMRCFQGLDVANQDQVFHLLSFYRVDQKEKFRKKLNVDKLREIVQMIQIQWPQLFGWVGQNYLLEHGCSLKMFRIVFHPNQHSYPLLPRLYRQLWLHISLAFPVPLSSRTPRPKPKPWYMKFIPTSARAKYCEEENKTPTSDACMESLPEIHKIYTPRFRRKQNLTKAKASTNAVQDVARTVSGHTWIG